MYMLHLYHTKSFILLRFVKIHLFVIIYCTLFIKHVDVSIFLITYEYDQDLNLFRYIWSIIFCKTSINAHVAIVQLFYWKIIVLSVVDIWSLVQLKYIYGNGIIYPVLPILELFLLFINHLLFIYSIPQRWVFYTRRAYTEVH